ncbi:MAG: hypothetical protein U0V56_00175 [Actinomycetota bacterium]
MPHLAERPLTMKRMPDGIDGPFFYEKSAPSHVPDWIGRCKVSSDDAKTGVIDYMTIGDAASACCSSRTRGIEFHPLHSRCADASATPTTSSSTDLFPPYTYEDVLTVARHIKVLLDQLGLAAFPKTSGATGLQIYVPVERGTYTYDTVRAFVGACGRMTATRTLTADHGVEDRRPHGQDLHRPQHEPRRGEHLRRVLAPARAERARVHAAHVGRGDGGRPSSRRNSGSTTSGERFERVGDLFAGVRTEGADLTDALAPSGSRSR